MKPAPAPNGWKMATLPSGAASFSYPSGWRRIETDPGTVSAALLGPKHVIRGYLNATPQSGAETLSNWSRFRPAHNREEGERRVVRESSAAGVQFRSGRGSCVIDSYATRTARYREIACIVRGARGTTVIVAAAPTHDWSRLAPTLRRSVESFST
jgi:hypothetical protein